MLGRGEVAIGCEVTEPVVETTLFAPFVVAIVVLNTTTLLRVWFPAADK